MLKIFLWGTGNVANKIINDYDILKSYDIVGFIDNDPQKQGGKICGKHIFAPEILLTTKVDKIVILTVRYEEIYQQIMGDLKLKNILIEDWTYFEKQLVVKKGIFKRYKDTTKPEIKNILKWLACNELEVFNYCFVGKYKELKISVLYDESCNMFYVMHQGKKMYFAKHLNTEGAVAAYYKSILWEQDKASPHRYLDGEFTVCEGDVVVDAGVAEGNFSLEIIEKVSKIYLIEADEEWVEALRETFKGYQDKVVIIQKYLTSMDSGGGQATLDTLIDEPVDFIKMDIEGNEWDALIGAEKLIKRSEEVKCAVCSYHMDCDEILIRSVLTDYGLRCTTTQGYMWFPSRGRDGKMTTKLCRGIVRGNMRRQI